MQRKFNSIICGTKKMQNTVVFCIFFVPHIILFNIAKDVKKKVLEKRNKREEKRIAKKK